MGGGSSITGEVAVIVLTFSFVSFLLTFPNFGPTSFALIGEHGLDAGTFFTAFYLTHVFGLLVAGTFVDGVVCRVRVARLSALILVISFLLSNFFPIIAILLVGFFLGIFADVMGGLLGRVVRPWRRGIVTALGISSANVFMFLFGTFKLDALKMTILSALPLLLTVFLPEVKLSRVERGGINSEILRFVPPIVIFYLLAGFMYHTMEPIFRKTLSSLHVLAYIVTIVIAGALYDRIGRKIPTLLGLFLLGVSFALFPRLPVVSAYIIQSSYAFLDVFSILIWVDLAYFGTESKHYGIGTSVLVASILSGYWIMNLLNLDPFDFGFLSLLLIVLSAMLVASAKEPMMSPEDYIMRVRGV